MPMVAKGFANKLYRFWTQDNLKAPMNRSTPKMLGEIAFRRAAM